MRVYPATEQTKENWLWRRRERERLLPMNPRFPRRPGEETGVR